MSKCIICNNDAQIQKDGISFRHYSCNVCGEFAATVEGAEIISEATINEVTLATIISKIKSQNIFSEKKYCITDELITLDGRLMIPIQARELLKISPLKLNNRIDNAISNLCTMSQFTGESITIDTTNKYLMYPGHTSSAAAIFIIQQLINMNLIDSGSPSASLPINFRVTSEGWQKYYDLESNNKNDSNICFVAMWFNDEVSNAYDTAIKPAITKSGYECVRIDEIHHNDKICDSIISYIRKSKFVVCDFTGHRGGVYYEAGFAHGLNIPVIFTCRHDHLADLHFDTRQFNHIVWENEEDLFQQLKYRIEATVI